MRYGPERAWMLEVEGYGVREGCRRDGALLALDQQEQCRDSVEGKWADSNTCGALQKVMRQATRFLTSKRRSFGKCLVISCGPGRRNRGQIKVMTVGSVYLEPEIALRFRCRLNSASERLP